MYRFLILAICCTFVHVRADAYHIIGGEIYYTYVGTAGDGIFRYEIVLKLYRDADFTCGPIQGCIDHFEDPVPINIYNGSGQRITNALQLYIKQTKPLRDTLKNPCLAPERKTSKSPITEIPLNCRQVRAVTTSLINVAAVGKSW